MRTVLRAVGRVGVTTVNLKVRHYRPRRTLTATLDERRIASTQRAPAGRTRGGHPLGVAVRETEGSRGEGACHRVAQHSPRPAFLLHRLSTVREILFASSPNFSGVTDEY
jgi:hypothetical protein